MQTAPISVVIPAYNAERFIRQAIRSVQNQTVKVSEIIVVDDGCTDRTAQIAEEMGVIVLEKPAQNQGVSVARNRGIRAANYEWIALLDADDYWNKRKIEYQWEAIQAFPATGFVSCLTGIISNKPDKDDSKWINWRKKQNYEESKNRIELSKYCSFFPKVNLGEALTTIDKHLSSVIFRRSITDEIGMFDETLRIGEDTEFFLRILGRFPWLLVHRKLCVYRRHKGNVTDDFGVIEDGLPSMVVRMLKSPQSYPAGVTDFFAQQIKTLFIEKAQRLNKEKKSRDQTFCVMPWVHAATDTSGNLKLCCVTEGLSGINLNRHSLTGYKNSDYLKNVRRQMLAGEAVRECGRCYREEANGINSHRMFENKVWNERSGTEGIKGLIANTKADGTFDGNFQYVDLRLGNTCNMQCVMCSPGESSKWNPLRRKLAELTTDKQLKNNLSISIPNNQFEWCKRTAFWSDLKTFLPHIKQINIAGGEPFLIKEHFEFIKECCETGEAGHISLNYNTNGTIFAEELVDYWKQFEKITFVISLDGINDVANYVRHPTDWENLQKNIARFDAVGGNTITMFHFTAHALNIYRLVEVLDWAEKSGFRNRQRFENLEDFVWVSLVHHPNYQTVQVLPAEFKKIVTDKINAYIETRLAGQRTNNLKAILVFMNDEDKTDKLDSLMEYTRVLDKARGTDFSATFPEFIPYTKNENKETF